MSIEHHINNPERMETPVISIGEKIREGARAAIDQFILSFSNSQSLSEDINEANILLGDIATGSVEMSPDEIDRKIRALQAHVQRMEERKKKLTGKNNKSTIEENSVQQF